MPFGEVKLVPGVNAERTPTLLEAGYSSSQLIRFRDGLAQKYGGWSKFFSGTVSGIPRSLHPWEDLSGTSYLGVATTTSLSVITGGVLTDITPQTLTTNPAVAMYVTQNNTYVYFDDPGIFPMSSGVSAITAAIDAVLVNVPVLVNNSGIILSGLYSCPYVTVGAAQRRFYLQGQLSSLTTSGPGGATITYQTTSGSSLVKVNNTYGALNIGDTFYANVSTTANGVTIYGAYTVLNYNYTTSQFYIRASSKATAGGLAFGANGGNAQFIYYLGTGVNSFEQTGTAVTASNWSLDNWGHILLACPENGPVFQWDPSSAGASVTAYPIATAPVASGGIFVSNSQQVLICWNTSGQTGNGFNLGWGQNPLLVAWSTVGDYTVYVPSSTNQAGSFVIPSGSAIIGGMAVANQNLIWTDLDLWVMSYIGFPLVYAFNKVGSGAGLISQYAAQQMRSSVYWMGQTNFYEYSTDGVKVIPCPIWDVVFQNLNTAYVSNIRAMPNTPFNEVGWLYPSTASGSGENDSYVKFNITEPGQPWDYGSLARSSWIDQTILGTPIAGDTSGNIWQHESTNDAGGSAMTSNFTTGYFYLAEGEEYVYVDQIIPDMKWGTFGGTPGASVQLTFNVINYPGDTPTAYGPYTMTSTTQYINVRFRGRQMSVTLQSSDSGSFWRIGKLRYRYTSDGRR